MTLNPRKPVLVYRNLSHGRKSKPLYSVMQNGRVVRRTHAIMLRNVQFTVRESGRQRVLQEGRKNVHAFAKGFVTGSAFGTDRFGRLACTVCYNPYNDGHFFIAGGNTLASRVDGAQCVILNRHGMTAAYTHNDEQDMRPSYV
jgi:hypothetical protein